MSRLVGNPQSLREFKRKMNDLPKRLAIDVAKNAAPAITQKAAGAYDAGQTVYGDPRPSGVAGPLSLVRTGKTRSRIRFVAVGSIIRAVLGTRYAKYLIGKYNILPNGRLPSSWSQKLGELARQEAARSLS